MQLSTIALLAILLGSVMPLRAQDTVPLKPAQDVRPEEKRIFGLIPNYKSMPAGSEVKPLTTRGKFRLAANDTFDPMAFLLVGVNAAQQQFTGQYPELHQGMAGYARRYIRNESDLVLSNFITEAIMPSALHLDPRYFRLGEGTPQHRTVYALTRIFRARGDDGRWHFNSPELFGNMGAVAVGMTYYPGEANHPGRAAGRYAYQVGSDAAFNVLKEFWPEIHDKVLRRILK